MTSRLRSYDPRRTVAQRWWSRLAGLDSGPTTHWQTKVAYYTAVRDILTHHPDQPLTWRTVVEAVRPRGSGSTFYEVTGRHAKHALIDIYEKEDDPDALQIALTYRRRSAVDQLIDETKVWSFWPYREAFLIAHGTDEPPVASYLAALASWAHRNPALAAALEYAPPACAVEDLVVLSRGTLATLRAQQQLTAVVRHAVENPGPGPGSTYPVREDPCDEAVEPDAARLVARFVHSRHTVVERAQAIEVDDPAPATVGLEQSLVA